MQEGRNERERSGPFLPSCLPQKLSSAQGVSWPRRGRLRGGARRRTWVTTKRYVPRSAGVQRSHAHCASPIVPSQSGGCSAPPGANLDARGRRVLAVFARIEARGGEHCEGTVLLVLDHHLRREPRELGAAVLNHDRHTSAAVRGASDRSTGRGPAGIRSGRDVRGLGGHGRRRAPCPRSSPRPASRIASWSDEPRARWWPRGLRTTRAAQRRRERGASSCLLRRSRSDRLRSAQGSHPARSAS